MLTSLEATQIRAAYVLAGNTPTAVSVEVRTLSDTEALIVTSELLEGERMVLCLDLGDEDACFLDADVVHRSDFQQSWMGGPEVQYSACRLRFRRKFEPSELHDSLLSAFSIAAECESDVPAGGNASQQQLMPVLSAIGLAVVHAWGQTI